MVEQICQRQRQQRGNQNQAAAEPHGMFQALIECAHFPVAVAELGLQLGAKTRQCALFSLRHLRQRLLRVNIFPNRRRHFVLRDSGIEQLIDSLP